LALTSTVVLFLSTPYTASLALRRYYWSFLLTNTNYCYLRLDAF